VRACGICHSDVALQEGYYDFASFPRVPGHEIAGTIEAVGAGVTWPELNAPVGLPCSTPPAATVANVFGGNEILCGTGQITGVNVDGGYQEFMLAPATTSRASIRPGLRRRAPLMCAGLTSSMLCASPIVSPRSGGGRRPRRSRTPRSAVRARDGRPGPVVSSSRRRGEGPCARAELFIAQAFIGAELRNGTEVQT